MLRTGRDPFARLTVRKRLVRGTCDWCDQTRPGGSRHFHPSRGENGVRWVGRVWEYYVDGDSQRDNSVLGKACGIECLRAYRGE